MLQTVADQEQLKDIMKQAFAELLHEQRDLLYDVMAEAIEDAALVNAIREGEATPTISRAEVFQVLERNS